MANLRITNVSVVDSTTITATFTENLSPAIGVSNIIITSQLDNVPSPLALTVGVSSNQLTITTQPLTPQAAYIITFQSTDKVKFKSLNGDAFLLQDGITNTQLIIGPIESDNPIQQFLQNYLKDNIYNVKDNNSIVGFVIQSFTNIFSKALYDIRQTKNENYISFTVTDELKARGAGPFDRLLEESAYEVTRVGLTPTGTNATMNNSIVSFPSFPVSLQANPFSENLTSSSTYAVGTFNINDFILTVSNQNVSKLILVVFNYNDGYASYTYNVSTYGYQILNSEYDQANGFSYATLQSNQFKLSESILNDPLFSIQNISTIQVSYEFRNLGRVIDPASVSTTTILQSIRETIPPIINVFNLSNAPITDQYGNAITSAGAVFTDPNAANVNALHPAFLYEIPYSLSALPYAIGQYSIDYPTGTVYVYGQDSTNSGTGPLPPLATYYYKYSYIDSIDYTYDSDTNALVALPNGSLINNNGTINFNYEQVLIPGIDYNSDVHIESLSEAVDNRLLALNIVQSKNSPITNVFRIYNETSGEVYSILRWSDNKIYFNYVNPPSVDQQLGERATFNVVLNEILFVNQQLTNASSLHIFKCFLTNNNIIASTEDSIASSINTSVSFSNVFIFASEIWWDGSGIESESTNLNRITSVGQYQIDYVNGVVYVAVSDPQNINIGTISYKNNSIVPQYPHVLSVDDIYYRISLMAPKNKQFQYQNFSDGSIVPASFDNSDEAFLNNTLNAPYEIFNNQVGVFIDDAFYPGVSNTIKFVRGLFEYNDLQNSTHPLNFAAAATSNGNVITVSPISNQESSIVLYDIADGYYVNLNLNLPYLSPNLTFTISVIRSSDLENLWDSHGVIVPGQTVKLKISANNPNVGDSVVVYYSIVINPLSRVIVDYNKGDYFIDYSYLADNILISYEYGDNVLDFRQSNALSTGDQYYATYKVGALRDALLANFGKLINIPELATFDVDLDRERYRDAVSAAMGSFLIGPTIASMENLVQAITHIKPEIVESIFQIWSLGSSYLNPNGFNTTGEFSLIPAKFGNGVSINTPGQTITLPVSSNLRLEQGSFQCWIMPEWDGIDNTTPLTFNILKNGTPVHPSCIFIGSAEYHPTIDFNNNFTIDKYSNSIGLPNMNKNGIFIYYAPDQSNLFNRWHCKVIDGYYDGYISNNTANLGNRSYTINIKTPGLFYDVKPLCFYPKQPSLHITSGTSSTTVRINSNYGIQEGIQFIADKEYYILDFGKKLNQDRLSIYKDPSGYMNLRVYDAKNNSYNISANISSWKAHQLHHVAAAWTIGSKIGQDELHLFIDGFEVPNIIRYGSKVEPYLHEKFRTVNPEEFAGVVPHNIVSSIDLHTTQGSNQVSSSLNFSAYGIVNGATINIDELGFNTAGYLITNVNGQTLTLNGAMPSTLTNGQFTINRTPLIVQTEINVYPNIAVSTISSTFSNNDLETFINSAIVSSSTNFANIAQPGYLLRIDGYATPAYTIINVSGTSLTINDKLSFDGYGLTYHIYPNNPVEIPGVRALRPSYTILEDGYYNNILTLNNNVSANDLVLINTLGINNKRVRQVFYQWGNSSNIIQTRMPTPIDLNSTNIYHILLPNTLMFGQSLLNPTNINFDGYSDGYCFVDGYTAPDGYYFSSVNNILPDQPTMPTGDITYTGRTLSATLSSGNINFTLPFTITINGYTIFNNSPSLLTEVLSFSESGTQQTVNQFSSITNVVIDGYAINPNKSLGTIQLQEFYPITNPENAFDYPVIRYSYPTRSGTTLTGDGYTNILTDGYGLFSDIDIGNYIQILSASQMGAAGIYQIISISADRLSVTVGPTGPTGAFTNGNYQVLRSSSYRSGFQNGYFTFEYANNPGKPYPLKQGSYLFDFYTYLEIKFSPVSGNMYFGSDINGKSLLTGALDEIKISSIKLTDTRVGEVVASNTETITKDFNSIKQLKSDANSLVLAHFDAFPFTNDTSYYIMASDQFIQASNAVNDNFSQSLYVTNKPIIVENNGILNSQSEGTIEFWVNPLFDTGNDPNYRYYFDASGTKIENTVSLDDLTVQVSGRVGEVISVKTQFGNQKIDYFVDGEIDTTSNGQFIRLRKQLLNQNTPVVVTYVPSGLQGDRISIFKDDVGYLNFNVHASGIDYVVRSPIFWSKGTWHRVKASYIVNSILPIDNSIRLLVDGYEQGNTLFGTGLLFGDPLVFGSTFSGASSGVQADIKFKDFLGELYIGSDYTRQYGSYCLIDNFRISNMARPVFEPFGESIDVNWNSNLNVAFPVTQDLYTTLLLNFDTLITKNTNFITLIDKYSGIYDFTINVLDSFGYVASSAKVKEILETLINILKPANSRCYIKYTE